MAHPRIRSLCPADVMTANTALEQEKRKGQREKTVSTNTISQQAKYTKNWARHDPIPFGSKIIMPAYTDYLRDAGNRGRSIADLPLEQLPSKNPLISDNAALSVPTESSTLPGLLRLLQPAEQEVSAVLVASSRLAESLIGGSQSPVEYPAKTQRTNVGRRPRVETGVFPSGGIKGKGPKPKKTTS